MAPDRVHGRDDLIDDLVGRVRARRPVAVRAPDQYGKTTVLGCVEARLAATVVRVDLFELRSWADLAVRLDTALAAVPVSRRAELDRVATGLGLELGSLAACSRTGHPAPAAAVDDILEVVAQHARAHPTVLVVDDCSSIARLDGAAERLRTFLVQHHGYLGVLAAGSERTSLSALVGDVAGPNPGADVVELSPLSLLGLTRIVDAGFAGSPPPSLASRIHGFTRGHPQRSMQLADAAWTAANEGVDPASVWSVSLERCRAAGAGAHAARFAGLQPADQAVMRMAATDGAIFGRAAALLSISRSSAQLARSRLVDRGQIVDSGDRVSVVDPLYADWIRRRFPF